MPTQNLIVIHRIYETFEARDFASFFSLLSPEVQIMQCPELPFGGVFHGQEGARTFFGKVGTYLDSHVEIERLIDSNNRIAMVGRTYGTVKATDRSFDTQIVHLWELRDGLVVRLEIALDLPALLPLLEA